MKKFILLLVLVTAAYTNTTTMNDIIPQFDRAVENLKKEKVRVAVGNITYQKIGTDFSRYIAGELSAQIARSAKFEEFSRDELDQILKEQKLSQTDLFNQDTAAKVGNLKGLEAIITGEYVAANVEVILTLKLLSIKTSKVISTAQIKIAKSDLPQGINFLPVNLDIVKENQSELLKTGKLDVKVWVSKGDGGVYKKGEKLFIFFKSNKDCYVRLFHIDAVGVKKLIFPNEYHPESKKVVAEKAYVFPDSNMTFDFELSEPYGTEQILAVASLDPFTDKIEAFTELKGRTSEFGKKGLDIKKKNNEVSQAKVYYTIAK